MQRTMAERWALLQQFGCRTMSYSTLQPCLEYFDRDDGYIAYRPLGGNYVYALCDPICAASNRRELIAAFVRRHPKACFAQTSAETAYELAQIGYWINVLGTETTIHREDVSCLLGNAPSSTDAPSENLRREVEELRKLGEAEPLALN